MRHRIDHVRGEMVLELAGTEYQLRMDFDAISRIQSDLDGEDPVTTAMRIAQMRIGLKDCAAIIARCSGSEDVSEIGNAVLREGLVNVLPPLGDYFALALGGFRPPPKAKKDKATSRSHSGDS